MHSVCLYPLFFLPFFHAWPKRNVTNSSNHSSSGLTCSQAFYLANNNYLFKQGFHFHVYWIFIDLSKSAHSLKYTDQIQMTSLAKSSLPKGNYHNQSNTIVKMVLKVGSQHLFINNLFLTLLGIDENCSNETQPLRTRSTNDSGSVYSQKAFKGLARLYTAAVALGTRKLLMQTEHIYVDIFVDLCTTLQLKWVLVRIATLCPTQHEMLTMTVQPFLH